MTLEALMREQRPRKDPPLSVVVVWSGSLERAGPVSLAAVVDERAELLRPRRAPARAVHGPGRIGALLARAKKEGQ